MSVEIAKKNAMKYPFLLVIIIFFQISYCQTTVTEVQKIETLINIWGIVKYHHPEVSKGKFDMNEEFINEYNRIVSISNQEQLNQELVNWIKKFDTEKTKYKTNPDFLKTKNLFTKNSDFSWIKNSKFSPELIELIEKMKDNAHFDDYYASINSFSSMVEFKNEKGYSNFDSSLQSNRLLFLSSFWNIMRYWNVNIYLTDTPWSKVLKEVIPEFISNDEYAYENAKHKLVSKLNDSHSDYSSTNTTFNRYSNFPAFKGKIVNDSLVITHLYNTDLAKKEAINLGDVIYTVERKSLKSYYLDKFSDKISASNENFLRNRTENFQILLAKNSDSIQVGLQKKDGSLLNKYIRLYKYSEYAREVTTIESPIKEKWQKLNSDIGYINLSVINKSELGTAFKSFENTKGIVIDLRNYPRAISATEIAHYLYPTKKVFIKTLTSLRPGYALYDSQAAISIIKNPFSAGSNNTNYYKGKVILLVNRATQSKAEWIGMAIQQSPNCITLGEQTAGAVLNINRIVLVDKSTADFTGMGAFYPNDEGVQRKGLKIDYEIKEGVINYNPNAYIEKAIDLIQQ